MAGILSMSLLPLALAGKLFFLWLLGVPLSVLVVIFLVAKIFFRS